VAPDRRQPQPIEVVSVQAIGAAPIGSIVMRSHTFRKLDQGTQLLCIDGTAVEVRLPMDGNQPESRRRRRVYVRRFSMSNKLLAGPEALLRH
jgi:hypothetical protein